MVSASVLSHLCKHYVCTTVDLNIFVVKIFSWFPQTTKIKNTKVYFTTVCVVSFKITKPGNVEPSKIFSGYPGPRKYFLHENLKHENFITQKFPDLRYYNAQALHVNTVTVA